MGSHNGYDDNARRLLTDAEVEAAVQWMGRMVKGFTQVTTALMDEMQKGMKRCADCAAAPSRTRCDGCIAAAMACIEAAGKVVEIALEMPQAIRRVQRRHEGGHGD